MDDAIQRAIDILEMQRMSAPTIFLVNRDLMTIINALKDFMAKIHPGCGSECANLIKYLEYQNNFEPNVYLPEDHIQLVIDYLKQCIELKDSDDSPYIPVERDSVPYGKCVLQVYIENEEEYQRWKDFHKANHWEFMHLYPAILRYEYEFHTTYDIDRMSREIVNILQQGFNVRAVDWKIAEYKSQL